MAEKKGVGHAYNVDFLNVVFAASSLFLFLSVIWMVWDDYDREWKNTQRRFAELEYQVTQASLEQASRGVDQTKLAELQAQLAAAEQNIAANSRRSTSLEAQHAEVDARLARESQDYQFAKATYDQDRYDFEAARAGRRPQRRAEGPGRRRAREADERAGSPAPEDDRRAGRPAARARSADGRGGHDPASRSPRCRSSRPGWAAA